MPSAPAIQLELRRSRIQQAITIALIVIAGTAVMFASWPTWIRLAMLLAYAGAVWTAVRLIANHGASVRHLEWQANGAWRLSEDSAETRIVELTASRVFGPLIALTFRPVDSAGCRSIELTLWPDSADREALRRLRIRLARESGAVNSPGRDVVG